MRYITKEHSEHFFLRKEIHTFLLKYAKVLFLLNNYKWKRLITKYLF